MSSVLHKLLLSGLALLLLLAFGGRAEAQCAAGRMVGNNFIASGSYDPFSATDVFDAFTIQIRNNSGATCSYGLVFHRTSLPATMGGAVIYAVTNAGGTSVMSTTAANVNAPVWLPLLNVPAGATVTATYYVSIARGQVVGPATRSDPIEVWLYGLNSGGSIVQPRLHRDNLTVRYTTPTSISTNVAGGGSTTTVDFGELVAGASRSVNIEARSNVNYQLRATSLNLGVMRLPAPYNAWSVGYAATLGGAALGLGTVTGTVLGPSTPTPAAGRSHPLAVTVGTVADKRAGTYTDEVTIRIEVAP
jgi:hypothetical protein